MTVTNEQFAEILTAAGIDVVDWRTKAMEIGAEHPRNRSRAVGGFLMTPTQRDDGTIGHHGASSRAGTNAALRAITRQWWRMHVVDFGWSDLFYGVTVGDNGSVCIGRGVEYTYGSTAPGVPVFTMCFPGFYHPPHDHELTTEQIVTMLKVLAIVQDLGVATRFRGHRQYTNDSACPGDRNMEVFQLVPDGGFDLHHVDALTEAIRGGHRMDQEELAAVGPIPEPKRPPLIDQTGALLQLNVLRRGARGPEVAVWQGMLWTHGLGHHVGDGAGRRDGIFDKKVEAATRRLQRKYGLDQTGIVDVATWSAALMASKAKTPRKANR